MNAKASRGVLIRKDVIQIILPACGLILVLTSCVTTASNRIGWQTTICTHCQATNNIQIATLRTSNGWLRCYQCSQGFSAWGKERKTEREIDRTLLFKVGTSIIPARGRYYYDLENEGRTLFYSGGRVAWIAVVGDAYNGYPITVELIDVESGESAPLFSTVREPSDIPQNAKEDRRAYPGHFDLKKQASSKRKILRLTVASSVIDRPLIFQP